MQSHSKESHGFPSFLQSPYLWVMLANQVNQVQNIDSVICQLCLPHLVRDAAKLTKSRSLIWQFVTQSSSLASRWRENDGLTLSFLVLLPDSSSLTDLSLLCPVPIIEQKRLLKARFIYLINWLLSCLGNAKIFLSRNPSNKQTEVQQSGLKKQQDEGQLISSFFSFLVAMTAPAFIWRSQTWNHGLHC